MANLANISNMEGVWFLFSSEAALLYWNLAVREQCNLSDGVYFYFGVLIQHMKSEKILPKIKRENKMH